MVMTQMAISLIYQYWIHTELIKKMPNWFESIFKSAEDPVKMLQFVYAPFSEVFSVFPMAL